jgi:phosphatidylinositol alpha-1,6-mannosyltransferase
VGFEGPVEAPISATRSDARIVLMSEWFPPAVGGSAELLANIYSRLPDRPAVLTRTWDRMTSEADAGPWTEVVRTAFGPDLGVVGRRALRQHLRLVRQLKRLGRSDAVVHCGRALPEGTAAMMSGRPYVCWTHGEELPIAATSRELTWLQTRVHRRAAALLANSHHTARMLEDLGNAPGKISVVHPGVDVDRFKPRVGRADMRRRLLSGDELMLLTVGRLQARKGHDLVLQALAASRSSLPHMRYVIVGDGPERARLEELTSELALGELVTFAGEMPAADLPACYAAADVFVHPNRVEAGDFEGFGIVFLEAAASGLPVIGGRSGGVGEAVEEGVTGWLVGGRDPAELGSKMLALFASADLRARMGGAGRTRVASGFTWEKAARRVASIDERVRTAARVGQPPARASAETGAQP